MSRNKGYTAIPRDGLVGEWLLDGNANDTAGTNNGTANNVTWVGADKGYVKEAGSFNGSSSYISGIGNQIPSGVQSYYAFWVKPTDLSGGDTFGSTNPRNILGQDSDNISFIRFLGKKVNIGVNDGSWHEYRSTASLTENEYQFIEVLITPSSTVKVWRNGILLGNDGLNDNFPTTWNNGNHTIGRNTVSTKRYYKGELSLIRRYTSITDTNSALYKEGQRKLGPTTARQVNGVGIYSLPNLEEGKVLEISKPVNGSGKYIDQVGGLEGTPTDVTESKVGQVNVMWFNGSSSNITAPQVFNGVGDFSFISWFKTTNTNTQDLIGHREDSGGNQDPQLIFTRLTGTGIADFGIRDINNNFFELQTNNTYNDGKWHLGVFYRLGSDIYINIDGGKELVSMNATNADVVGDAILTIGKFQNTSYFNGQIGLPMIYNRALSSTEIQQLYYSQKGNFIN